MPAARVVPALDEVEDAEAGLGRRWEALPIEQLALEGCEEALAEGVVVGVTHAAHRGPDPGLATPEPEGDRGVLAALVGVMDDVGGTALRHGPVQRRPDELRPEMGFPGPAGDAPTPRAEDDGEIQEPRPGRAVGECWQPEAI